MKSVVKFSVVLSLLLVSTFLLSSQTVGATLSNEPVNDIGVAQLERIEETPSLNAFWSRRNFYQSCARYAKAGISGSGYALVKFVPFSGSPHQYWVNLGGGMSRNVYAPGNSYKYVELYTPNGSGSISSAVCVS